MTSSTVRPYPPASAPKRVLLRNHDGHHGREQTGCERGEDRVCHRAPPPYDRPRRTPSRPGFTEGSSRSCSARSPGLKNFGQCPMGSSTNRCAYITRALGHGSVSSNSTISTLFNSLSSWLKLVLQDRGSPAGQPFAVCRQASNLGRSSPPSCREVRSVGSGCRAPCRTASETRFPPSAWIPMTCSSEIALVISAISFTVSLLFFTCLRSRSFSSLFSTRNKWRIPRLLFLPRL